MNIKLPVNLGMQATMRITQIVQQAGRNPDGTLTAEGSQYIRDSIAAEFGQDLADAVCGGEKIEFDYSGKAPS